MKATFRNIEEQITDQLQSAENSVLIAVAWFTNNTIFDILLDLVRKDKTVELIVNNDIINNRQDGLDFNQFIKLGGKFFFSDSSRLMHHKFTIIDNNKLISGSYNWTYNAEFRNNENIVTTDNLEIIDQFKIEFAKLKSNAQPQTDCISPPRMIDIVTKEYLKDDYFSKSVIEERKGNMKKSLRAIQSAEQLAPDDSKIAERVIEVQKKIEKPKYCYHVEDRQFWFDHYDKRLLGKEGDVIKIIDWCDMERDVYILYVDGFYVECIGNIERSFPKTKQEHDELKEYSMKLYEQF